MLFDIFINDNIALAIREYMYKTLFVNIEWCLMGELYNFWRDKLSREWSILIRFHAMCRAKWTWMQ